MTRFRRFLVSSAVPQRGACLVGLTLLLLLVAGPAQAHGISTEVEDRSILGFIPVGIEHMLVGWDHLLFVAGVLLVAQGVKRAATLISFFVIGHSTTLIAATLAGWRVNPDAVDVVIVLSVAFVGATAMIGQPRWDIFGATVFAFGLVHGLGLSTRLQDLGLPADGLLLRVIAFNVGIELGQLTAIIGMLALAAIVAMTFNLDRQEGRRLVASKVAAVSLFATGAMIAPLLAYFAFSEGDGSSSDPALAASSTCTKGDRSVDFPGGSAGHPEKKFFEPDETGFFAGFAHSIGDGYVIVLYPQSITDDELGELRDFVSSKDGDGVLAGPDETGADRLTASTIRSTMTCREVETESLRVFSKDWRETLS